MRRFLSKTSTRLSSSIYQPNLIMPTFDVTNKVIPPESYIIDCGSYNLLEPPETHPELCEKMKTQFKNLGLVLLTLSGHIESKMTQKFSKIQIVKEVAKIYHAFRV